MEFLRTHFNNLNLVDDEVQKFCFLGILLNHTTLSFAVLSGLPILHMGRKVTQKETCL
jgi:hypothetical protein